ncbi:MAG TPA: SdrD B-like domain-containing protein [Candidatus Binatia bacterium]|nr:SdrD B-like domain-containing protein [Candidatus Binatia bacterium]
MTPTGFNGTSYLLTGATGNTNTIATLNGHQSQYERYDYQLDFPATGTYTIWIRGYASSTSANSLFVGLDGTATGALTEGSTGAWVWTNTTTGIGSVNTITISSAGLHTISVWAREAGHRFDGFFLTSTSVGTTPSGGIPNGAAVVDPTVCSCPSGTVGGYVYRDYNADGTRDALEPGVGGVTVTAYDASNNVIASVVTASNGAYTLTGVSSAARIEFTGWPSYLVPAPNGASNGTSVQFVTPPSCNVGFGLLEASEYCQSNPTLAVPWYVNGNPLGGGSAGTAATLVSFPYTASGTTPAWTQLAIGSQIGATWGLAYQRSTTTLFATAVMKRHVGFGPLGTGGLYSINTTGPTVTSFVNLASIGIPTGSDPHSGLPSAAPTPNHDPNSWDPVGKISIGDIDISDDERTLWVMSLSDRSLYEVFINKPAVAPTAGNVTQHALSDPGCSNGEFRPWGLKVHDGLVYIGVVCSAETSQNPADVKAYVLSYDPSTTNFSTVMTFPLNNFSRGCAASDGTTCWPADWLPWISSFPSNGSATGTCWNPSTQTSPPCDGAQTGFSKQVIYPQPLLSDIEFDERGAMILGFIDRLGMQTGNANWAPSAGDTFAHEGLGAGDMLRACKTCSGSGVGCVIDNDCPGAQTCNWSLESNGSCLGLTSSPGTTESRAQGPGGGEFYWGDNWNYDDTDASNGSTHDQVMAGGLAQWLGSGEIVSTMFDPLNSAYRSQGVGHMLHTTGGRSNPTANSGSGFTYQIFADNQTTPDPSRMGKAAGVGDVETFCQPAPIELGNYVWKDTNGNGIQDVGEPGISGVTVHIYQGATLKGTTTTSSAGQYYFNAANVTGGVLANTAYSIRLDQASNYSSGGPLNTLNPTTFQVGGGSNPTRDSNGVASSSTDVRASVTTGDPGNSDHTIDFGFVPPGVTPAAAFAAAAKAVSTPTPTVGTVAAIQTAAPVLPAAVKTAIAKLGLVGVAPTPVPAAPTAAAPQPAASSATQLRTPTPTPTPTPNAALEANALSVATPTPSPTPPPSSALRVATSSPVRWARDWSGSFDSDPSACVYRAQPITVFGLIDVTPPGSVGQLETTWRVVQPCPPGSAACAEHRSIVQISGSTSFAITAQWPGIRSTDSGVGVLFEANLLDASGQPIHRGIGKDLFWFPNVCPPPTPAR